MAAAGDETADRPGPADLATQAHLLELLALMRRLRAECAWKGAQTHRSLVRYLLEEAHETVEAIESGDSGHLQEELGDLLLQVWFHAVVAEEAGEFTLDDVVTGLATKLRSRNPHVFGSVVRTRSLGPREVNELWESVKAQEKGRRHPTEGIPAALPALLYADKVVDRLARAGTPVAPIADGDLGERLLALVVEARAAGEDPEQLLREAVRRRVP